MTERDQHTPLTEPNPDLELELHRIDGEINAIRRRLFLIENGMATPDPVDEADHLRDRFRVLGDEFVGVYRRWSAAAAEE